MYYIATFYSHFGAIRFKKSCQKENLTACMMPVPRELSSSCGTCVRFEASADACFKFDEHGEMEQLVRIEAGGYIPVYKAKES